MLRNNANKSGLLADHSNVSGMCRHGTAVETSASDGRLRGLRLISLFFTAIESAAELLNNAH